MTASQIYAQYIWEGFQKEKPAHCYRKCTIGFKRPGEQDEHFKSVNTNISLPGYRKFMETAQSVSGGYGPNCAIKQLFLVPSYTSQR